MSDERPIDDGHCFGCGRNNPIGLQLHFEPNGSGAVRTTVVLTQPYQGWRGVAHGGIVATLMDEAMAYAAGEAGYLGMTAELTVRFRKPVPLDEPLELTAHTLWQRRNVFAFEASISDAGGTVLASAQGNFVARDKLAPGQVLGEPDGVE
ncbi:MAG: PaaI family thioesterase [Vulcanimicrobiaceae bacterium]